MAGRGPAAKDPAKRRRRNADEHPTVMVEADGDLHGPDLPALPDGTEWAEPTKAWWDNWRRSPQAQLLGQTDWDFLLDTALLHSKFWNGEASVGAELRLRVAKFGATPEDRMRLRLQIGQPTPVPAPDPDAESAPRKSRYAHLSVAE